VGTAHPHINLGSIKAYTTSSPLGEQHAIAVELADQVSVIDHLESDLEAKLKSASTLRQSILGAAFEGKLVPQDPNDEPATELLKRIAAEREERQRQVQAAKKMNVKGKLKVKRKQVSRDPSPPTLLPAADRGGERGDKSAQRKAEGNGKPKTKKPHKKRAAK
jgi:type I restriction enzyme S subunit